MSTISLFQFVDGKVFLQTGKTMKPAAVRFVEENAEEMTIPTTTESEVQNEQTDESNEKDVSPLVMTTSQDKNEQTPLPPPAPPAKGSSEAAQTATTTNVPDDFWTR